MTSLRGTLRVVPDKSLTHRGALLGALTQGRSRVANPNPGEDCRATLRAVEALGVTVIEEAGAWILERCGELVEPEDVLDLGNSGTGLRLLAGVLAGCRFLSILTGDASLRRRPMTRVMDPLRQMGASVDARAGGRAPLAIRGGDLRALAYEPPMASAQVKSCLLLAGVSLRAGTLVVREPVGTRDHTERLLEHAGARLQRVETEIQLEAPVELAPLDWTVPGDISAAAFFLVASAITPGSAVTIEGVGLNPTRSGVLDVLVRMGARLRIDPDAASGPEPIGTLHMEASELRGTVVSAAEVPRLIDEIPVLAVAAGLAEGVTEFRGVGELRHKESDRIATTAGLLRALGVEVETGEDLLRVQGQRALRGGSVRALGDHRIAMAARVAGCASREAVVIDDSRCIGTSDPTFESQLQQLRRGSTT